MRVCKVNTKEQEQVSWSWVYKDIESGRQVEMEVGRYPAIIGRDFDLGLDRDWMEGFAQGWSETTCSNARKDITVNSEYSNFSACHGFQGSSQPCSSLSLWFP